MDTVVNFDITAEHDIICMYVTSDVVIQIQHIITNHHRAPHQYRVKFYQMFIHNDKLIEIHPRVIIYIMYHTATNADIWNSGGLYDRLISTMGFPILVKRHLYIELGPRRPTLQRRYIGIMAS